MEQESDRIERHIEERREHLGRNLDELEDRVRSTFDWRKHYNQNPWLVLVIAFSGAATLSATLSGRRTTALNLSESELGRAWRDIGSAIVAAGTRRVETFLGEVLPHFGEEYRKQQHVRPAQPFVES